MSLVSSQATAHPGGFTKSSIKVRDLRGQSKSVAVLKPASHSFYTQGHKSWFVHNASTVPTNLFRNNSAKWTYALPAGSFDLAEGLQLRIRITEGGAANSISPVPTPYWFDRIVVRNQGSNDELMIWEPDVTFLNLAAQLEPSMKRSTCKLHNMSEQFFESEDRLIPASGSRTFHLRLAGLFEQTKLPFFLTKSDLVFEFTPSSSILQSGSGQVDVTSLDFIFETRQLMPDNEKAQIAKEHSVAIHSRNYLMPQPVKAYAKALANSTELSVDLDTVNGQVSFIACFIRTQGATNADCGLMQYHNLGKTGSIDIRTSDNQSIWSGPIESQHLLQEASHQISSDLCEHRAVYLIPFCRSIAAAYAGVRDGFLELRNDKVKIVFKPAAAGTATVQTLNLDNPACDAGFFALRVDGPISAVSADQAHNATVGALKSACDSLVPMRQWPYGPLETTFSGTLETDATVTFSSHWGKPEVTRPIVQVEEKTLNDGGVGESVDASITTVGSDGYTNATCDISIYAFVHAELQSKMGYWETRIV